MMNILKKACFFSLAILLVGFIGGQLEKKVIRTKEYDIHFYVLNETVDFEKDKMYHWYKSGEIHNSFGAPAGKLLHKEFLKYYADSQLAEKGEFYYGLKNGLWKQWYNNGYLMEEVRWRNGERNGSYTTYGVTGEPIIKGSYHKNEKDGIWVDLIKKDTTWFEDGIAYNEPPRVIKKRMDSINGTPTFFQKITKPFRNLFGPKQDSVQTKEKKEPKEEGFLKRLFSKKEKQ
ncbi:MAG: hypothetical protein CMC74_02790 [Flavobacteriaceae bacterium]|nr:hypothetical protein [Flavobacteriaceae bacterium]|tara:strand:- start:68073 stop:68765 length:693 start_codon:yes stop_codon:yes gene_type:complete